MMSLWDALRMNMMISYQELVRTFPNAISNITEAHFIMLPSIFGYDSNLQTLNLLL